MKLPTTSSGLLVFQIRGRCPWFISVASPLQQFFDGWTFDPVLLKGNQPVQFTFCLAFVLGCIAIFLGLTEFWLFADARGSTSDSAGYAGGSHQQSS